MIQGISLSPEEALIKWFPDTLSFHDRQKDAIERIWNRQSSLVLMPTGMGKSLIYQLPVFASRTIGVIISPPVALMQQQSALLRALGATVLSLGGSDAAEAQEELRKFPWSAGARFLFVSPERPETDGYLEYLLRKHRQSIGLIATSAGREAYISSE
jgi:ATP-dependent DNA helicase RecQ